MLCSQKSMDGSQGHSCPHRAVFPQMWKNKGETSPFQYTDKECMPEKDTASRSKSLEREMKRALHW